jgi:hypothetical protein
MREKGVGGSSCARVSASPAQRLFRRSRLDHEVRLKE